VFPDLDIYGRQSRWYGESTCMSKFVTTNLLLTLFTGMRFALMQVKTGLCHILSRFEVAPCKETPLPIVFDPKHFLTITKGDMLLSFKQKTFWSKVKPKSTSSLSYRKKKKFLFDPFEYISILEGYVSNYSSKIMCSYKLNKSQFTWTILTVLETRKKTVNINKPL
jgi:hypothetical protein